MSEHEITVNNATFWYTSISVHKDEKLKIEELKLDGFWEACLWGDNVSLLKIGRIKN